MMTTAAFLAVASKECPPDVILWAPNAPGHLRIQAVWDHGGHPRTPHLAVDRMVTQECREHAVDESLVAQVIGHHITAAFQRH